MRWLVLLIVLPACMRGCNGCGAPAEWGREDGDCETGACRGGYCVGAAYAGKDSECRQASACRETGACSAVTKSSFLGLSSELECAAVLDEDCHASQRCAIYGACTR